MPLARKVLALAQDSTPSDRRDARADLTDATTISRTTTATPEQVWAVIADGWTYGAWVVGASRVRAVESQWPAARSKLYHSVGAWPAVLSDSTSVLESEPARRILLSARTRPAGIQSVEIALSALAGGGTEVSMREDAAAGPVRLVPLPARQAALALRNRETLHRLCLLAERATDPESG